MVGVGYDAHNRVGLMQRLRHHHQRSGRAVGDGNNSLVPIHVGPVDLGHHQRDLGLHAEGGTVVDHHRTGSHRRRTQPLAYLAAGRDKRHVDSLKRSLGRFVYNQFLPGDRDPFTRRATGGEKLEVWKRSVALLDDA